MNKRVLQSAGRTIELNGRMRSVFFKLPRPSSNEPQLRVWIKSAVPDPASEEVVLSGNPIADQMSAFGQRVIDLTRKSFLHCFVGIQLQHPIARRFFHR